MKNIIPYVNVEKLFDLEKKICLITGTGGIGDAIAEAFAEKGAVIALADQNYEAAKKVKENVVQNGGTAEAYMIDVTNKESVTSAISSVVNNFGRIDILVHTAGIGNNGKAIDYDEKQIERILDVNLMGTIFVNQCVGKVMAEQKSGKIINIGSIGGHITHTLCSMPYSASKAGVHQVTRSFAGELAEYGINVNSIAPTWTNTEMIAGRDKKNYECIAQGIPFGRLLEAKELVGAAVFLATDASNFITGQIITVDGGYTTCKALY